MDRAEADDGSLVLLAGRCVEESRKRPIVARTSPLEDWHRFDGVSTSEFIHRILTDREFRPFSMARKVGRPFFEAYR
ncbi:hypothetical protein B7767_11790 [Streptomyces sp. 13-12-16]|nr:hypothetical protein B7767_11790 [Streptomyces sp. 13-12-16]